jgi:hypothetical protein
MSHPYADLPPECFWSEAMSYPSPGAVDPVTRAERIEPDHKIATMGSCFAQHLSSQIVRAGLCFFVAEQAAADLPAEERSRRNYDLFSARYGNVYTARQALQLFMRAFGMFAPAEGVWARADRFVDAFRPRIEPDGFASAYAVLAEMARHLAAVQRVFLESDWLILTLGLTEGWRSRVDGAVYPLAPGVAGGAFDPLRHEFVNFSTAETISDLDALITRAREVNPRLRFLLTVSPVALAATYEKRHVLVSTVCSKSILRAAADEMERRHENVLYFPAYEIVTSPAAEGRYFADDLRQVNALGVEHVMRVFRRHFVGSGAAPSSLARPKQPPAADVQAVCDEEEIVLAVKRSLGG